MLRNLINRYPLLSQSIQASVLISASDIIAQKFVERKETLNKRRTLEFAAVGFFMIGPTLSIWYKFIDKKFSKELNFYRRSLSKVAADQLIAAPIFAGTFISAISLVQGMSLSDVQNRLNENYLTILKTNYTIWPLAQLINFSLIPLKHQVLFAQCIALIWNTYLSNKLCKKDNLILEI